MSNYNLPNGVTNRKYPSAKCRHCGKIVRVRPAGGDWLNAINIQSHKDHYGIRCAGSFMEYQTKQINWPEGF